MTSDGTRQKIIEDIIYLINKQKQKYIMNNERDIGGWQDEIDTCKKILSLIKNYKYE